METNRRENFDRWFAEHQRDLRIERLLIADMEDRAREIYGANATDKVKREWRERAARLRSVDEGAYRVSGVHNETTPA